MLGMSGGETIRTSWANRNSPRCLSWPLPHTLSITSAKPQSFDGFDAVITKPCLPDELAALIDQFCQTTRASLSEKPYQSAVVLAGSLTVRVRARPTLRGAHHRGFHCRGLAGWDTSAWQRRHTVATADQLKPAAAIRPILRGEPTGPAQTRFPVNKPPARFPTSLKCSGVRAGSAVHIAGRR